MNILAIKQLINFSLYKILLYYPLSINILFLYLILINHINNESFIEDNNSVKIISFFRNLLLNTLFYFKSQIFNRGFKLIKPLIEALINILNKFARPNINLLF